MPCGLFVSGSSFQLSGQHDKPAEPGLKLEIWRFEVSPLRLGEVKPRSLEGFGH